MTTTFKEFTVDYQKIYLEAIMAATAAGKEYVAKYGEDPYCGFGWVEIPDGRSPFVNWCKKNNIGSKHWKKGWQIWRPTGNGTQSMSVLEAEADAFADVLNANGITAWACSRAD